jgi:hypothetical protein
MFAVGICTPQWVLTLFHGQSSLEALNAVASGCADRLAVFPSGLRLVVSGRGDGGRAGLALDRLSALTFPIGATTGSNEIPIDTARVHRS